MSEKQKILFIINPISGDIKKANLPEMIEKYLDKSKFDFSIKYTERVGHATHLAKEAVENNFDVVATVGGDGSVNEVAQALVNTNTALAVIPLGSGNGLAYHLHLPIRNVLKALENINNGKTIAIDTGTTSVGEFVSFAGSGLEAYVARTYRHIGRRGFFGYAIAVIKELLKGYKAQPLSFEIDGEIYHESIFMFTIYNAKYMGYKVGKVGEAKLQDGKFHLMRIRKFPFWKLLYLTTLVLIGKMHWAKETTICEAEQIKIFVENKKVMQVDGDSFVTSQNFEAKINKASLKIIVTQDLSNC
jgi:YegS/Rv2252/BmrU family lipid kinase